MANAQTKGRIRSERARRWLPLVFALACGTIAMAGSAQEPRPPFYPGTAVLPPYGFIGLAQAYDGPPPNAAPPTPYPPGYPPAGTRPSLWVESLSDQLITIDYDGITLTLNAPPGSRVRPLAGCAAVPAATVRCPATARFDYGLPPRVEPDVLVTTASAAPLREITYPAGWNMVGLPGGTVLPGLGAPLYTFAVGDTAFRTLPATAPLEDGVGYWAYFTQPTTVSIPTVAPRLILGGNPEVAGGLPPRSVFGPSVYAMVGNPFDEAAYVDGADVLYVYDPQLGYQTNTVLQPGQAGWAFAREAGPLTLRPARQPEGPNTYFPIAGATRLSYADGFSAGVLEISGGGVSRRPGDAGWPLTISLRLGERTLQGEGVLQARAEYTFSITFSLRESLDPRSGEYIEYRYEGGLMLDGGGTGRASSGSTAWSGGGVFVSRAGRGGGESQVDTWAVRAP